TSGGPASASSRLTHPAPAPGLRTREEAGPPAPSPAHEGSQPRLPTPERPQRLLVDLVHGRERQLGKDGQAVRPLEARELRPHEGPELREIRWCGGVARDDEGPAHLAEDGVRDAHEGRAPDLRVTFEQVLDLGRIDVVAAADEHLAPPATEAEIAGGVEDTDVPRVHPAVGIDGGRRRLRIPPVAAHRRR